MFNERICFTHSWIQVARGCHTWLQRAQPSIIQVVILWIFNNYLRKSYISEAHHVWSFIIRLYIYIYIYVFVGNCCGGSRETEKYLPVFRRTYVYPYDISTHSLDGARPTYSNFMLFLRFKTPGNFWNKIQWTNAMLISVHHPLKFKYRCMLSSAKTPPQVNCAHKPLTFRLNTHIVFADKTRYWKVTTSVHEALLLQNRWSFHPISGEWWSFHPLADKNI